MARNDPTIYMRVPQELKDMLDTASAQNRRSLTAEVVARLQSSFKAEQEQQKGTGSIKLQLDAVGGDGPWTEEFLKDIATEAAEDALRKVLNVPGVPSTVKFGTPGLVQGPPPDPDKSSEK